MGFMVLGFSFLSAGLVLCIYIVLTTQLLSEYRSGHSILDYIRLEPGGACRRHTQHHRALLRKKVKVRASFPYQ